MVPVAVVEIPMVVVPEAERWSFLLMETVPLPLLLVVKFWPMVETPQPIIPKAVGADPVEPSAWKVAASRLPAPLKPKEAMVLPIPQVGVVASPSKRMVT